MTNIIKRLNLLTLSTAYMKYFSLKLEQQSVKIERIDVT